MKDMKQIFMLNNSQGVIGLFLGLKSRITSTKPLLTMLFMLVLGGWSSEAWGQSYHDNKWWSLYSTDEYTKDHVFDVVPPTDGKVSFEWRKSQSGWWGSYNGFQLDVSYSNNGSNYSSKTRVVTSTIYEEYAAYKFETKEISGSENAVKVKFSYGTCTRTNYFHNVQIRMAKHILLNDGSANGNTSLTTNFSDTKVEATSEAQTINFRSFLTNGNIKVSLTKGDPEVFRLGTSSNTTGSITSSASGKTYNVGANACASGNGSSDATANGSTLGDITKYGFNVYFRPKADTNYTGTITITDGTSKATVTLSGKGVLNDNTITWSPATAGKKNWGDQVNANATSSNTNYSGDANSRAITYTVESGKESYVTIADGKITFNQAGAGKTVTITAHQAENYKYKAASQSRTFTIKQSQAIVWDETKLDTNIRAGKSRDINGYAYGEPSDPNGVRVITYSSSNSDSISVSGTTITAKNLIGPADIIATLSGDADYNEVTSSKTFTVKERETVEYYFDGVLIKENDTLDLKVGETSGVVTSKNEGTTIASTTTSSSVAVYNTATKRIEAKGEGTAIIHLVQDATDDYQNGNRAVVVKVSLNTTTISTNVSAKAMDVGDTFDPELSTTSDTIPMNISSSKSDVAVYEDGVIKAVGAGSTTITFAQAKTTVWTGDTVTIVVTVSKKDPVIEITGIPTGSPATAWNQTIEPVISSTNTDEDCAISFERISGSDAAARQFGGSIKVYDKNGETVTFRVTQAGNYKWNAASKDFSFKVQKANNHVTYTYGNVSLGDEESQIIGFVGVPYKVQFTPSSSAWTNRDYNLYWSEEENGTYIKFATFNRDDEGKGVKEAEIDPHARYLKVEFDGGTGIASGTFQNVTITERKEIAVEGLTEGYYDFGNKYEVGNPATDKAVGIKCYSVPTTEVTSSNPSVFEVVTESVNSEIDQYEETSVTIRYHHKKVTVGTHDEATITLTSENGYTTSFKVKGKTNKKDQTLIWQDELTPISVGEVIPHPAIAPLALNYSITETTEEGVVEVVDGVLKAKKVGTVTLHVANDGDAMWNPVEGECTIKVTDLKVQRLNWDQTFTRLKKNDADITLNASVYERNEAGEAVAITARSVNYTSDNEQVVTIVNGKLHIVGVGTANLAARVAGVEGEYEPAEVIRKVKVRTASAGCTPYVLENKGEKLFTIATKEYSLSGEPAQVTFKAKGERFLGWPQAGPLRFAEYYDGGWHERFSENLKLDEYQSFGPIDLNRNTTRVKFYTTVGATCYHTFDDADITKAKYLELEDTPNKTTTEVAFDDSHLGQTYIQSVVVNYSNIYDMLYVDHKNKNFRITPTEIGNKCGEDDRATVTIIYYAKDAITEKDTITITDEHGLTATIYVSASVAKSDQTITWDYAENLNTTDDVTFEASASSGLPVTFALAAEDAEVATLTEDGKLTIQKAGDIHVTVSQEGSNLYNPTEVSGTIHINKVTPSVSVKPVVTVVTLPSTLSASELNVAEAVMLNDKSVAVEGTYSWTAPTTILVNGEQTCEVLFTPAKEDWYNTKTFTVTVTANKRNQVITWDVTEGTKPCSEIIALNAVLTDGVSGEELEGTLSYSSDNKACAEILEGKLNVKTPGTVTVTVSREGSAIYNEVSITRTFTFEKTMPVITTLPTAHAIYQEQWLHESALVGGVVKASGHEVSGDFEWTTENFMAVHIGTQNYNAEFVPANEACYYRVPCVVPMTILQFERIFTDSLGNKNWNDPDNWSNGFVPPSEVSVTIGADVEISSNEAIEVGKVTVNEGKTMTVASSSEVTVGTVNLPEGSTLVVEGNSHLTVGESEEDPEDKYGDVYVRESATLTVSSSLKVNNIVMSASLNGGDHDASSSQIEGVENLDVNGDAFIDITFDPSGKISYGWYDFVVPFEVNMHGGIARINSADDKTLVYNVDFVLIEADEVARAQGGKPWKRKQTGVLIPGKLYSISFDDEVEQNTFRFTWNRNGSINNGTSYDAQYADAIDEDVKGWNGMGNGMMCHGRIADGMKVQAYNHEDNVYELVAGNRTFAVGTAFFVQATQEGTINWSAAEQDADHPLFAPKRAPKATEEFMLTLRQDDRRKAADVLYFSASEEATENYMIGHDLAKMGTLTDAKVAQMWTIKNGKALCDVEKKLENKKAITPVLFYAPMDKTYTLSIERAPEDATLYLTYNGRAIWNLSMSAYEFDLEKGTTEGYGLRIVASQQTTTDIDQSEISDQSSVRKVLIDDVIYIVTPEGKMYDIVGKGIKF